MHRVVHRYKVDPSWHLPDVGMPAVQQHREVMIPVQEADRPPPQNQEHGVDELEVLREDEGRDPEPHGAVAVHRQARPADRVVEPILAQQQEEVRHGPKGAAQGEDREKQIPRCQGHVQVPRLTLLHGCLTPSQTSDIQDSGDVANPPKTAAASADSQALEVQLPLYGIQRVPPLRAHRLDALTMQGQICGVRARRGLAIQEERGLPDVREHRGRGPKSRAVVVRGQHQRQASRIVRGQKHCRHGRGESPHSFPAPRGCGQRLSSAPRSTDRRSAMHNAAGGGK
mmetsp:Transcript_16633/g.42987  ORF Transcript_16633/g.42987 Transcript_16633/m.42987 type:complete len:284 (+) Transcript_16633:454-1305(+)